MDYSNNAKFGCYIQPTYLQELKSHLWTTNPLLCRELGSNNDSHSRDMIHEHLPHILVPNSEGLLKHITSKPIQLASYEVQRLWTECSIPSEGSHCTHLLVRSSGALDVK